MTSVCIAVDAMGGDFGVQVTVPAALDALSEDPTLSLILVGDESLLKSELEKFASSAVSVVSRLVIHHASQQVLMDEPPEQALRTKKDSSMRVAINLVKSGAACACVSAGNTGALIGTARFVLKMLPGLKKPAILYSLPVLSPIDQKIKFVRMLDLGATLDCEAQHLVQFAMMGSVLASLLDSNEAPRVALLNVGSEAMKGPESIRAAAAILAANPMINYTGYIEGNGIFRHAADVVVCDGFVGNVALKCTEGMASMFIRTLKQMFQASLYTRILALFMRPLLKRFLKQIDPEGYNGASVLGVRGIVIKSHGNAKRQGFTQAIREAVKEAKQNIPERIALKMQQASINNAS